jgi:MscS family membrane protein
VSEESIAKAIVPGKIFPVATIIFWLLSFSLAACAQALPKSPAPATAPAKSQDPLNRDSPQSSVFAFLEACRARDYARARRYLDLRKLPEDQRLKDGTQLAEQLEKILDRDVQFDVAALSRNPEGAGVEGRPPHRELVASFTVNGKTMNLELERVTLRSGLSVWLFSSDSVALIPQLAQLASDSPVERHLPAALVSLKVIDTPAWRWIALALLVAALAPLSRLVVQLVLLLAEPILKRVAPYMDRRALQLFDGPLRLLLSVAAFRMGMAWIGPSALLRLYLERCLALAFFAGLAWLCMAIVDLAVSRFRLALEAKRETFSYSVLPLASRVLKLTILVLMIAAVLGDWGYNTTTILAGLGVGGLAIALAAQKTIENFFGGVAVISDRPVFVGDFCRFGDRVGTVEDIGLRSTRLRTPDRTLITVPNAQFSSMTLESFSKRDKMLFHLTLNLRRDTTPEQVRSLLTSITTVLTQHPKLETGQIPVRFIGVGTYSLDLEVDAYIKTRADDEFLQIRQELLLHILDAIEGSGTALALPTQASVNYSLANALNANGAPAQEVTR